MKVLSLFDGMSCGQIALERVGVNVTQYFASEIDKHAIKVAQANYPNTIQLGDVTNWQSWNIPWHEIDLVIGGSPCQGFSFAGKQLAFDDPRSRLFFEFSNIVNHVRTKNPNMKFLLENVKMKKEFMAVISDFMGVEPMEINSNLVSAQNRSRFYWSNIEGVNVPEDKGIMLKDIIHENDGGDLDLEWLKVPFDKTLKIISSEVERRKIGYFRKDCQSSRVYSIHGKAVTLCGHGGGNAAKMGQYLFGCITPDRVNKRQNGQRFNDGKKFYTLTSQDRHGVFIDGYIRKLSPIECERLQTVPDNYTAVATPSQRYKMIGNGWTIDVIAEFFEELKK